jgi:hypothetical protein
VLKRLRPAVAAWTLLVIPSICRADPITFNFAGTLTQPMNGSNQFSGSFTINADPTAANIGFLGTNGQGILSFSPTEPQSNPVERREIAEYGGDVSITVNVGGQTLNYVNTAQNPTLATFSAGAVQLGNNLTPNTPLTDLVSVWGNSMTKNAGNSFTNNSFALSFSATPDTIFSNLAPGQVANLRGFNFAALAGGVGGATAAGVPWSGRITSLVEAPVPEPSTLVVFAVLSAAAMGVRRVRKP